MTTTWFWESTPGRPITDSGVALDLATLRNGNGKRFPIPIRVDENAAADEPALDYLAQENQHDIDFLLTRARVRGYIVAVEEEDGREPHLYFGPSHSPSVDETYELVWGQSLIDFTPTLTTANQVGSVTVHGWDRRAKKQITGKAERAGEATNRDLNDLFSGCIAREEIVVTRPVFSQREADALAKSILETRVTDTIKCSGTTIGLPLLRAGRRVEIAGLGARFSGSYFVTESTHTINDSGYVTKFQARREEQDGPSGAGGAA